MGHNPGLDFPVGVHTAATASSVSRERMRGRS